MPVPAIARWRTDGHGTPRSLCLDLLDIRQRPFLVEELLLRPIEPEHQLELASGIGRNPIRFLASQCLGTEIKVDRPVGVLFQLGAVGGPAGAIDILDERMRVPIIGSQRPILLNRHMGGTRRR